MSDWLEYPETQMLIRELKDKLEALKTGLAMGEIWGEGEFNRRVGFCQCLQSTLDYIEDVKKEYIL